MSSEVPVVEAPRLDGDVVIQAEGLGKAYRLYRRPQDRLRQAFARPGKQYYREFWALRDLSFEVRRGEAVGVLGVNGSGKSTLLQLICGVLQPSEGRVSVRGRVSSLLELGAGFNPEYTGVENVQLAASIYGLSRSEIDEKLDEILAFAAIGDFVHEPVKTYSSGMYVRLAFAVAMSVEPDILVVDEALAVGDANFQRRCMQRFYEVRERGCTLLLVSHDSYQIKAICNRALLLDRGQLVSMGSAPGVADLYAYRLQQASAEHENGSPTRAPAPAMAPVRIEDVRLLNPAGKDIDTAKTGDAVTVRATVVLPDPAALSEGLSFVVNLYRHDGFYICGTTTIMDKLAPFPPAGRMQVDVTFPDIQLLAGRYQWRFAVNDHRGLGIITEAVPVCPFQVVDEFQSVGLVHLPRSWMVSPL